jgi:hypothetical protein
MPAVTSLKSWPWSAPRRFSSNPRFFSRGRCRELWGGLLVFAFWKGILIYTYFMHMKFEGWIVKCLIAPTPILIAIVLFALMPDIAFNSRLDYPVGSQLDKDGRAPGQVVELGDPPLEETTGGEGH